MVKSNKEENGKGVFLISKEDLKKPHTIRITVICILFFILLTMGMTNLYSTSLGTSYFFIQLRNLLITIPAFILFAWFIPIRRINSYAYWVFGLVCLLLLTVLLLGRIAGGAQRWISIAGISFQPSEFAKLATAIIVARFFHSNRQASAYTLKDIWPLAISLGMVFAMIFSQPDFGTAGVCILIALAQIFFIRIDYRSLGILFLLGLLLAFIGWHFVLMEYQKLRVINLFNPDLDPQNSGYNSLQSIIAVGSGNIFGKGFLQGTQAHLRFLPERHTDFAFSVFAEEHGFWAGALVFILFSILSYIALDVAKHAKDTFSGLLAIGIAAFIFLEFSINVAMVLGIFPVVGIPLPFFSYGSSSLLTICIGLGLLVSINRATYNK
ncbi:MAG: rod shape-determining protein RodA [Oligoflexales bacterium]|nr:rod shape-determining protein RodA [Oligoflexales bacterium]